MPPARWSAATRHPSKASRAGKETDRLQGGSRANTCLLFCYCSVIVLLFLNVPVCSRVRPCSSMCVHVQRRRHLDGDRRWRGRDGPDLAFGVDAGKDAVDMWDMWDMWVLV